MEQNENPVATADAAWPPAAEPGANPPGGAAGDPPSRLDFDPVAVQYRCDGWTPDKQRAFIEELADCGVVREAPGGSA